MKLMWITVIAVLAAGFVGGGLGFNAAKNRTQNSAVEAGVGSYVFTDRYGAVEFQWAVRQTAAR